MPDVIIKGMEMPESCFECPCVRHDSWRGEDSYQCNNTLAIISEYSQRPDWCPLRPAPEWISVEVRCRECRYYERELWNDPYGGKLEREVCILNRRHTSADDYCSDAERKEGRP